MNLQKILILLLPLFFIGCSGITMNVSPEVSSKHVPKNTIEAKVEYEGNSIYLPSNVLNDNSVQKSFRYSYKIDYKNGNTSSDVLNLFNPLVLVGFQMSEEGVIVNSKAELFEDGTEVKSFTATCVANKPRSLFQNGGSSDARQACLLATKESIENQISDYIGDKK